MTIQKGRDWGELATVPFNVVVANDEAGLARVVAEALQSGSASTSVDVPQIALRSGNIDRKSTRLNSSHVSESRMPSSA